MLLGLQDVLDYIYERVRCFLYTREHCVKPQRTASFIAIQRAINMKFVMKNPLPGEHISTWRLWNKIPVVIGLESSKFNLHSSPPIRIGESTPISP